MSEQLAVAVHLENEKVRFSGVGRSNPPVVFDYHPPVGDDAGYTGLEGLLMSLAACSATSVVSLLRRMHKTVSGFRVEARGDRRDEHPTVLTRIELAFLVDSPDATDVEVERAIQLSEEKFCPVWAMLRGNVVVVATHRITGGA